MIVHRYKFNTRIQQLQEDVSKFVARLRELAEFCEFGDRLDDHLRDRLVCGVRDYRTKRRLLTASNLTFQKAWEIARSLETVGKNVAAVQKELVKEAETHKESVHKLKESGQGSGCSTLARRNLHCQRCGGTNHTSSNCRFKNTECFVCKTRDTSPKFAEQGQALG